jgi:hypothetical protein
MVGDKKKELQWVWRGQRGSVAEIQVPSSISCSSCRGYFHSMTRKVLSIAEILRKTRSENQSGVSQSAW